MPGTFADRRSLNIEVQSGGEIEQFVVHHDAKRSLSAKDAK